MMRYSLAIILVLLAGYAYGALRLSVGVGLVRGAFRPVESATADTLMWGANDLTWGVNTLTWSN